MEKELFDDSRPGPTLEGVTVAEDGLVYPGGKCLCLLSPGFPKWLIMDRYLGNASCWRLTTPIPTITDSERGATLRPDTIDMQQSTRQLTDFYYYDPKEEGEPFFQPDILTIPKGK
jgi:hypothetical protein